MTMYSHSKLSTFEQCPLKFKYRYLDKIILDTQSIEAFLGKIVHDTLEWLYFIKSEENQIPSIDKIIEHYANKWESSYNDNIVIIKKEFTTKDYFNKGVKFILDYYTKHHPFDEKTIGIEKRIVIELSKSEGHKIQGFIDRLVHNSEKDEYEIHDYKTSNFLPQKEKFDTDRQLALYSIGVKELFGKDKNVILVWHYLAHNIKICSQRTNEQLEQLKKEILELIHKIESTTEFPPNKSSLCDWCEYNSMCPLFKKEEASDTKQNSEDKTLDIWD